MMKLEVCKNIAVSIIFNINNYKKVSIVSIRLFLP